jgi:hypothetical protein
MRDIEVRDLRKTFGVPVRRGRARWEALTIATELVGEVDSRMCHDLANG